MHTLVIYPKRGPGHLKKFTTPPASAVKQNKRKKPARTAALDLLQHVSSLITCFTLHRCKLGI
ncbi:uncharacterized protein METZ01_LOCUS226776 [marine metagenome]|uniref:Uncharacterized protein n=1 Tax=marine metagenome TaxID=408172 RepID=A0A382GGE5_9ZZZZ